MTDNNRNSNKPKGNEEVSRQTTESGGGGECGCVEVEGGGGRETRIGRRPDSVGFSAGL